MKHAKKMIMIPEVEYLALLSMMRGDDPLRKEKALIDAKIHQNFSNKNISEDIKAKKYEWLLKQKRKLRELIEGKPQKVIIENLPPPPNIPPYMGINQEQQNKTEIQEKTPIRRGKTPRNLNESINTSQSITQESESLSDESEIYSSDYDTPKQTKNQSKTPSPTATASAYTKPLSPITPRIFTKLMNYVGKNKENLGINSDGSILTNFNKSVRGSNYVDALKYMSGQLNTPPKGYTFLKGKLSKDPEFIRIFGQIGRGKKNKKLVVVKLNPIKTPGLKRNKIISFKPKLWARL
jgi:hypothetical protein